MGLPTPRNVEAAVPIKRPSPDCQILWPTALGYGPRGGSDSTTFPSLDAIKARNAARPPEALQAFVEAAWIAEDRILVIDDFLFKPRQHQSLQSRYDQILSWFPVGLAANDIRLLTNALGDHAEEEAIQKMFNERGEAINRYGPRREGLAIIRVRFTLGRRFPYVHDRFAVIDNELWHFGATVGGLHYQVNAATRGWDADARGAVRFFDEAWSGDSDARRG